MPENIPSQKLLEFNKELEALCKRYLYKIKVVIKYKDEGISGQMQAVDDIEAIQAQATETGNVEEKATA